MTSMTREAHISPHFSSLTNSHAGITPFAQGMWENDPQPNSSSTYPLLWWEHFSEVAGHLNISAYEMPL